MEKIKIAYVISTLENCGPVNILFNLIKYLNRSTYEPLIITLSPENHKTRIKEFQEMEVRVVQLNLSRIEGLFKAKNKVKAVVKKENIQILHGQSFRADGIIASISNIPTTNTLHNYPFYDFPMTYGKVQGNMMAKKHLQIIKKLTRPIACSQSVAALLKENQKISIEFVQNGVDTEVYQPSNRSQEEWKQKLDLETNKKLFIVVGTLSRRKDPLTIIEAFNNREEQLLFLGEGELLEECKKKATNPNIKFLGRVENVADYLKAADFYISAAHAEGLPNTVLEALSSGVPTILSAIGPHDEILDYDKKLNNFLFKVGNENDLFQKIEDIKQYNYDELRQKSETIIKNYLSAQVMAKNYEAIYQKLMEEV